jgi:hypothetical protein
MDPAASALTMRRVHTGKTGSQIQSIWTTILHQVSVLATQNIRCVPFTRKLTVEK